jgi:hypothetical protein
MSDFLVAPFRGKTDYKIDPTLKGDTIIWPSSKMPKTEILVADAATILNNKWNLTKVGKALNLIASNDGYYQIFIKHWYGGAVAQPLQFRYAINNGTQIPIGWVYHSGLQDIGVFLQLKSNDVVTIHSINTGYSNFRYCLLRKLRF